MHIYPHDGKEYHSVSLILSETAPIKDIIKWRKVKDAYEEKNGKGSWDKNCDAGRERGTAVHKALEYLALHNPTCGMEGYGKARDMLGSEYREYAKHSIMYHKQHFPHRDVIAVEQVLVNTELAYGGTADLIYYDRKDDVVTLLDYKTFKGYKDTYRNETVWRWKMMDTARLKKLRTRKTPKKDYRDWDYVHQKCKQPFIQLAMYKTAAEHMKLEYKGKPYKIEKLVICVVTPYGVQEIAMPMDKMWDDCHTEMHERIKKFHQKRVPIDESKAERIYQKQ